MAFKHMKTEYEFHMYTYIFFFLVLQLCPSLEVHFHVTLDQYRIVLYGSLILKSEAFLRAIYWIFVHIKVQAEFYRE